MLKGKVAIVTGASRGIGRAIVERLAAEGASVVLNYARNEELALEVQKNINSSGGECIIHQADVGKYDEVKTMVDAVIERFGKIDILINNAGIVRFSPLKDMNPEDWNDIVNTNLTGVFNLCRLVSPHMVEKNYGKIVNISSAAAIKAIPPSGCYSATKAGVMQFTKVLAMELIQNNINVNCIAPGTIMTEMLMSADTQTLEGLKAQTPAKRIAEGSEIADLVCYLCRDESRYIVGQTISMDGGMTL